MSLNLITLGNPAPEVSWYKDKQKLKPKKKDQKLKIDYDLDQDMNILTINDATMEDSATYTIKAKNSVGSVSESAIVTVEPVPVIDECVIENVEKSYEKPNLPSQEESSDKPVKDDNQKTAPGILLRIEEETSAELGETVNFRCKFSG